MKNKFNILTPNEQQIIWHKSTEQPFSGQYNNHFANGIYICKQCNNPLYLSKHKFASQCGWPSFDDAIAGAIISKPDADGHRTEILCSNCNGHLGHVFTGENLTAANIRHCVNSIAMCFIPFDAYQEQHQQIKIAYFAGGCFWGVEHLMQQQSGVIDVVSGYMGGHVENPTYTQVCQKNTGHIEVVQIIYNQTVISYENLTKLFFEIHDPTQTDGQGPDHGPQYKSVIFTNNIEEIKIAEKIIANLEIMGFKVATKILPAKEFWPAEEYHQNYYAKNGSEPYCHRYKKIFND